MLIGRHFWEPMFDADGGAPGGGGGAASPEGAGSPGEGSGSVAGATEGVGGAPQAGAPQGTGEPDGKITPPATGKTFTQSEVEGMIRARIAEARASYEKQLGDSNKYKGLAERIANMTGVNLDTMEEQLAAIEAEAVSRQTGIPPQVYQEIVKSNQRMSTLEQDNLRYKLDAEEAKMLLNPAYADMKKEEVNAEVKDFASKTGITLEQAFWATQGSKGTAQMEREIEQRIMASIESKAGKSGILKDTGSGFEGNSGLSDEELAFVTAMGGDPDRYAAAKGAGNIEEYRRNKKARGK